MTEVGYTKTIKPVRDWNERIWRLMFAQQLEITRGRVTAVLSQLVGMGALEIVDFKDPGPSKNSGKAYEVTKGGLALVQNMIGDDEE